jgi:hypothetical protein
MGVAMDCDMRHATPSGAVRSDANDPDTFVLGISMALAKYPAAVVAKCIDNSLMGGPRRHWPPDASG